MRRSRSITNVRYYKNETKKGNRTATKAKNSVNYYSFDLQEIERDPLEYNIHQPPIYQTQLRGQWHDQNGEQCSYDNVKEWATESTTDNRYTYQIVLSMKSEELTPDQYLEALQQQDAFTDYRFIIHDDTDNQHAHVMAFSDKTLSKAIFKELTSELGKSLDGIENQLIEKRQAIELQNAEKDLIDMLSGDVMSRNRPLTRKIRRQQRKKEQDRGYDDGYGY